MESIYKGNLSDIINSAYKKKKYIEESIIWKILTQILIGLNYLHNKGIIHRDLTSKNIFLNNLGIFKIAGFNGFCLIEKNKKINEQIGTPLYTAPEIWNDQPYNYKCDIWSVGCIIYELANLSLPFNGDNIDLLYKSIMSRQLKPIPEFYSQNLKNIINSMLIFDPLKRPSTDKLLNDLNIKRTKNELNYIYMNTKMKKIILNRIKNKLNKKEINLGKNKIKINSRSTSNINSISDDRKNEECSKITLTSNNEKTISNSTYRTLKERINKSHNFHYSKKYNCIKIKIKNRKGNINNAINDNNNHTEIVNQKFKKININNEPLNKTPNSSYYSSKIYCNKDDFSNTIQNYSFKNPEFYEKLNILYNGSKSIKDTFKQKVLNNNLYGNECNSQIEKNKNFDKIKMVYINKKQMNEKLIPKQKNFNKIFFDDRGNFSNQNNLNKEISLLNNESHNTSTYNSEKKNKNYYSNFLIKNRLKLSYDNFHKLKEKTIIEGKNHNNILYNSNKDGNDDFCIKCNGNTLRNMYTLEKISYTDNFNTKIINYKNYNDILFADKSKPFNFNKIISIKKNV